MTNGGEAVSEVKIKFYAWTTVNPSSIEEREKIKRKLTEQAKYHFICKDGEGCRLGIRMALSASDQEEATKEATAILKENGLPAPYWVGEPRQILEVGADARNNQ